MTGQMAAADRRLRRQLHAAFAGTVRRTDAGTWATGSHVPHDIGLLCDHGLDLVAITATIVTGARPARPLLDDLNALNVGLPALTSVGLHDGTISIRGHLPASGLRAADLAHLASAVLCSARLHADQLATHIGVATTAARADLDRPLHDWPELLDVSGTATAVELVCWMDLTTGMDSWADEESFSDLGGPILGSSGDQPGTNLAWPFTLRTLLDELCSTNPDWANEAALWPFG